MRKLQRSNNRVIAGVCGGIANYFKVDPTIIRLAWIIGTFIWGVGVLAYIIAVLVMPPADITDEDISNLKSANMNGDEKKSSSRGSGSKGESGRSEEEFNSYFNKE